MKTVLSCLLIGLLSLDAHPMNQSLKAEVVWPQGARSRRGPAYWTASCGQRSYIGTYIVEMDWEDCDLYCEYNPHAPETGHTYQFADVLDKDEMECLRYNMNEQFKLSDGYAGHYWIGGYSDYPGGAYHWKSGNPFEFDDFVENPGTEPYLHLTPENNYAWNTKTNNDNNNGCLCKSKETIREKKPKMGRCCWEDECSPNWIQISPEKCLWWPSKNLDIPDDCYGWCDDRFKWFTGMRKEWITNDPNHDWKKDDRWLRSVVRYCQEFLNAEPAEWSSYGEYVAFKALKVEKWEEHGGNGGHDLYSGENEYIGSMKRQGGIYRWNSTGEIAFTEQDDEYWQFWGPESPSPDDNRDFCVTIETGTTGMSRPWSTTQLDIIGCDPNGWAYHNHRGMVPKPLCMRPANV